MRVLAAATILGLWAMPSFGAYMIMGEFRDPCNGVPPAPPMSARQDPTVPYEVYSLGVQKVQDYCAAGREVFAPISACAVRHPTDGKSWIIVIADIISGDDYACALTYEKAHLPPNNWRDQRWEDQGFKGLPYLSNR